MTPDRLARALRRAVEGIPGSRRELCRAAGVDQSVLAHVLKGNRRASAAMCKKIARALHTWGTACESRAAILTRALTKGD